MSFTGRTTGLMYGLGKMVRELPLFSASALVGLCEVTRNIYRGNFSEAAEASVVCILGGLALEGLRRYEAEGRRMGREIERGRDLYRMRSRIVRLNAKSSGRGNL